MKINKTDSILKFYESDTPDVLRNLAHILNHGKLADTGRLIISAVDQGFEHGPTRSFSMNEASYDPHYHFKLAIDGGLSAFAAPLGLLESGCKTFEGQIPTILKMNSCNALHHGSEPDQAITATVEDALRLGCKGIGFTLYPGSGLNLKLINEFQKLAHQAKQAGLVVVAWSYPRGGKLSKEGETALDVISYGAHMACLLGAHIIKVKVPSEHLFLSPDQAILKESAIAHSSLQDRIRYVVKSCFFGRRVVIFSGGDTKGTKELISEAEGIHEGGGFGSIVGRNFFQRPREDALKIIDQMVAIYKEC